MKWIVNLKNKQDKEIQFVLDYCKDWLSKFDTRKLDVVRIDNGRHDYHTFYGRCHYPKKGKRNYIVSCQINENIKFPFKRQQRRTPIYFMKSGVEVEGAYKLAEELQANPKFELGAHCIANGCNGGETKWVRVYEYETYDSFDECIAAIFGHEISHFLVKTRQVKGVRHDEIQIDKLEDEFLKQYKKYKYNKIYK
jgi:hypothetical protein